MLITLLHTLSLDSYRVVANATDDEHVTVREGSDSWVVAESGTAG